MANKKTKEEKELDELLKDMVESLKDLPTDVLEQILKNMDEIEKENKKEKEKNLN